MKQARKVNGEREITYLCFISPALVLYILFFILPVGMGIYYSLTDWNGLARNVSFIGLKNYERLFTDSAFHQAFKFNAGYSVLLVVITVVLATILALCLNAEIRLKTFFRGTLFFPAVLSMLTIGMVFNEIFTRALPSLGAFLDIGVLGTNILSGTGSAMYGVLFVHIWQGLAIPTILLLAGLQTIPSDIFEAAELDGAGKWVRLKSIIIPFLMPVLSVVVILTFKGGLTVFDLIVALTGGGPAGSTKSLTLNIYNLGFKELKFGYAIAQAMVVTCLVVIISYIQIRVSNRKKVY
jgi:raffinose/stachyose/melibiose transport system permease protein